MVDTSLVVCVPARDEAERLPILLAALAQQTLQNFVVVLALNNTSDNSRDAVSHVCSRHPDLKILVDETNFAPAEAHAGNARRRAMGLAADLAGPDGLVLTTDADTRPPQDWLAQNVVAMARGLDIIGGRIVIDEAEHLSDEIATACRLADRYWSRVRAIEDEVDPVPWDLPPRHGDHTGASLCITSAAYRHAGGVPPIPTGEDRKLVQAVVRQGGRLAHPVGIWTRVSPRRQGRAFGGMAEHMNLLHDNVAASADVMLPSFAQWRARAEWRRAMRLKGGASLIAELEDDLPAMVSDLALTNDALDVMP